MGMAQVTDGAIVYHWKIKMAFATLLQPTIPTITMCTSWHRKLFCKRRNHFVTIVAVLVAPPSIRSMLGRTKLKHVPHMCRKPPDVAWSSIMAQVTDGAIVYHWKIKMAFATLLQP